MKVLEQASSGRAARKRAKRSARTGFGATLQQLVGRRAITLFFPGFGPGRRATRCQVVKTGPRRRRAGVEVSNGLEHDAREAIGRGRALQDRRSARHERQQGAVPEARGVVLEAALASPPRARRMAPTRPIAPAASALTSVATAPCDSAPKPRLRDAGPPSSTPRRRPGRHLRPRRARLRRRAPRGPRAGPRRPRSRARSGRRRWSTRPRPRSARCTGTVAARPCGPRARGCAPRTRRWSPGSRARCRRRCRRRRAARRGLAAPPRPPAARRTRSSTRAKRSTLAPALATSPREPLGVGAAGTWTPGSTNAGRIARRGPGCLPRTSAAFEPPKADASFSAVAGEPGSQRESRRTAAAGSSPPRPPTPAGSRAPERRRSGASRAPRRRRGCGRSGP